MSKMLHQSTPYKHETVTFGNFGIAVLGDPTATAWVEPDERFPCPCPNCTYHRERRDSDSER